MSTITASAASNVTANLMLSFGSSYVMYISKRSVLKILL